MTVLPDWEIEQRSLPGFGWIKPLIDPFDGELLQPSSYDVKLAEKILVPRPDIIDPVDISLPAEDHYEHCDIGNQNGYLLSQGQFVLGSTIEWVNIHDDIVGRIEGKSSRARQGIQIHSAGYLDPGFCGNVTLEIVNFSPHSVILRPNVLIAQLSFEKLTGRCRKPYSKERNHYQYSVGVVGSKYGL